MQPIAAVPVKSISAPVRRPEPASISAIAVPSLEVTNRSAGATPAAIDYFALAAMTWKERGDFHLGRKEYNLAIDAFTKSLQKAEANGNLDQIGECLKDLGRVFLEKEQWSLSAKIFNCAYKLLQKSPNEKSRQAAFVLMAEVERRFLSKVLRIITSINPRVYLDQRERLQTLRQKVRDKIQKNIRTQVILDEYTQEISCFIKDVLHSGFTLFGKPPCDYTLIGLGSLARKEMSPYSDLEFALLISKSTPDKLDYFRRMVQWLELQMIHLGETAIKILARGHESPVERGFSFDDGGNTPLGKQGYVELINVPEKLAQFQLERFYAEDLILSNVLRGADVIIGSKLLFTKYVDAIKVILSAKSTKLTLSIAQVRALNLLRGHLVEFEPRIDKIKEETPIYNIKAELYRLPSFLIAGLADYFGIGEQNTWKRLEALVNAQILCKEGAKHLQDALAATMRLRIRCHLYYEKECEDVYHPKLQLTKSGLQPQHGFMLTDEDINQIVEIYRVIFPLHRLFKQVCLTGDFSPLTKDSFYDASALTQGQAYEKVHRYPEAKKCYSQAVAMNPDDVEGLIHLARLLLRLEEHGQATEYADKVHAVGKRKNDEKIVARACNLQGLICNALGKSKKAITYYEEALRLDKKIYGNEHSSVSADLNGLGTAWQALGDAKKALSYYEEALQIGKKIYGNEHPDMATLYENLGNTWSSVGKAKKAIGYYQEALRINKKVFGDEHTTVITLLVHLGLVWKDFGNPEEAIVTYEEALRIGKKIFGEEHATLVTLLNNLGLAWNEKKIKKAIANFEQALHIGKKIHGDEHPDVVTVLGNLGHAWKDLGYTKKTIAYIVEALCFGKKIYGDEHPAVVRYLSSLGDACLTLHEAKKAIDYSEEALRIAKKIYGNEHPDVAANLNTLRIAWNILGDKIKAFDYMDKALRIGKKIFGDEHPLVARFLKNLDDICSSADKDKAWGYYREALRICKTIYKDKPPETNAPICTPELDWYLNINIKKALPFLIEAIHVAKKQNGDEHPQVVIRLINLGNAWQALGYTKKAIGCFDKALRISKKVCRDEYPNVATLLNNLGNTWKELCDTKKACECYEEALRMGKNLQT